MPLDRHVLYEAAVQGVEYDLDFVERVHRLNTRRPLRDLREDFCGTAALAAAWVVRRPDHHAFGVDHDASVLNWAKTHRVSRLGEAARRLKLARRDVRRCRSPKVDAVVALNFSYWVFRERRDLLRYFRAAHDSLRPGGVLVLNAHGGTEAMDTLDERQRVDASRSDDGEEVPGFTCV